MNEIESFANAMSKAMTIQQVADVLGVSAEAIKKHVREIYPDLMKNGIQTFLDESQVTEIKKRMMPTTQVVAAITSLEITEMTLKVIAYHKGEADRLRQEVAYLYEQRAIDAPKVESHNALMRSELTMSITDAAKHFGLHPKTEVFPYLRAHHYLVADDLPSQSAIDAGYLKLVQNPDRFGVCHPQAVVATWMLENWRAHVVHQIKRWAGEIK